MAFYRNGHACVVLVCISCLAFSLRFLFSQVLLRFIGNLLGLTVPVSFFPFLPGQWQIATYGKGQMCSRTDRWTDGLMDG